MPYASDAIYTRQSIEKADSISVDTQAEYCKKELTDLPYRIYTDKGYSGKNTQRPAFQSLMEDVETGKIRRVIVYRLDRVSRSVVDFAKIMELLEKYKVGFVSTVEKFDTQTPVGKAMLMIVMIFAQLERETIQQRVCDAYMSRCRQGFYMGGRVPYGYMLTGTQIKGKHTKMYQQIPEEAEIVRKIYQLYGQSNSSLNQVAAALTTQGITKRDGNAFSRGRLRDLLINPIYACADGRLYDFLVEKGAEAVNPRDAYNGSAGVYMFEKERYGSGENPFQNKLVVLAPHRGIVSSSLWIKSCEKCMSNGSHKKIQSQNWLAGLLKCESCGAVLRGKRYPCKSKGERRYYLCTEKKGICTFGSLDASFVEWVVGEEMLRKIYGEDLGDRHYEKREKELREEIDALMKKLPQANETVTEYIMLRVEELERERKRQVRKGKSKSDVVWTERHSKWEKLRVEDKYSLAHAMIQYILAAEDKLKIYWKY